MRLTSMSDAMGIFKADCRCGSHVLIYGIIAVASFLPVARILSQVCANSGSASPLVMMLEAFLCLLMLAGRIHWRIAGVQARQASLLATALHGGRLDVE